MRANEYNKYNESEYALPWLRFREHSIEQRVLK